MLAQMFARAGMSRFGLVMIFGLLALVAAWGAVYFPDYFLFALALPLGVIAFLSPTLGLGLLALTTPLEDVLFWSFGNFRFKPYEFILAGIMLLLILRRQVRVNLLGVVFALYILSGFLSFNEWISLSDSLILILFQFVMLVLFMAVRWAVPSLEALRRMTLFYILVVGNVIGLFALGQFVGYYLGFDISFFHPELYSIFRPYGTFAEPNPYGNFLAAQLTMAIVLAASPSFARWRFPLIMTAGLQSFLLVVNLSRAPWLGFLVAMLVYMILHLLQHREVKRPLIVLLMAIALVAVLGLLAYFASPSGTRAVLERIGQTIDPLSEGSARGRLLDLQLSWEAWQAKPLTGYGPGTWAALTYQESGSAGRTPPRNILIAWLIERGIIGAFFATLFHGVLIWRLVRRYRQMENELHRRLLLALSLGTLAVFATFIVTFVEVVPYYWFQIGALIVLTDATVLSGVMNANRA